MSEIKVTIPWGDTELEATVEYTFHRGCSGARDSLGGVRGAGPPLEPDEPPYVEITGITALIPMPKDPNNIEDITEDLTEERIEWLQEKCLEDVADRYEQEQEERHEAENG